VLQPAIMMAIFTLVLGRLAKLPTGGLPLPVFVFAGLLFWNLYSSIVSNASMALVTSSHLVSKVYFPRLIIPIAAAGSALVDFAIVAMFMAVLALWYGVSPWVAIIGLPALALVTVVAALGIGIFLSALIVSYRDFRFVVPFILQVGMFVTPVIYPASLVPDGWRTVYLLNPVAGVIETFRSLLAGSPVEWFPIISAAIVSLGLALFAILYYEKVERNFADVI
jgi:lipopolysaccharide transport system permease protein